MKLSLNYTYAVGSLCKNNNTLIGISFFPLSFTKSIFSVISVFIFSHSRTEYVVPRRSLSVRMSVCVSVVVSNFLNFGPILLKLGPHSLNKNLRWHFSQILKILLWWRHNGFFSVFQCATLTSLICVEFSSNLVIFFFKSFLCLELQSRILG